MSRPLSTVNGRSAWWAGAAVILAATWATSPSRAQPATTEAAPMAAPAATPIPTTVPAPASPEATPAGNGVVQTGCSSCGGGLPPSDYVGGGCCGSGDACGGCCLPGRKLCCCACFSGDTAFGRAINSMLECMCCPDPCYEGHWMPVADAAFFVDAARPVNQMRFRYDDGYQLNNVDRANYFWAREGVKGPATPVNHVDYQDLRVYTEAGTDRFSAFIEMPYEELDIYPGPILPPPPPLPPLPVPPLEHAGFGDMIVGTKSLLQDCEMSQLAFEFKTFIPIGNFKEGLGTRHVSLEPSLLFDLKLTNASYIQFQTSFWIPIAGDMSFQSTIWHNHVSFNRVLWCPCQTIELVGTAEANEWTIFDGGYTTDTTPVGFASSETTIFSAGPGLRLFVCDKMDVGVGSAFSMTGSHWEKELIRAELRFRF